MKSRHYLQEDIAQIRRYFPGAKPVALVTPFDLTPKQPRTPISLLQVSEQPNENWGKGVLQWIL